MAKFEVVSKYADKDITLPKRKTAQSAGYDFVVAEDIIIDPYFKLMSSFVDQKPDLSYEPYTLDDVAALTKETKVKPTLVPTGIKCELDPDTYLELSVRSSSPLKYWLCMANGVGIIDADYYNNPDNEGHIYFQIINFSPLPIILKKGDAIGQGIIKPYLRTEDDNAGGTRQGGFGSTDKVAYMA